MACEWLSQNGLALSCPLSDRPAWLWLLLLIPVLAVVSWRRWSRFNQRDVLVIAVRSLVILPAGLPVDVMYVRTTDKLTVFFLMDRSDSVKDLQEVQEQYLAAAVVSEQVKTIPIDRVGMIDFATNAYLSATSDARWIPRSGGQTS
ncbi:MAG: hypothetical protein R3E58_18975 [Phycisphaerae bacterium]